MPKTKGAKVFKDLRIKIIGGPESDGVNPQKGSTVTVNYTGYLARDDCEPGDKFDSSFDRKKPFKFKLGVGQVIQGWDEGVGKMTKGQTARISIPSEMGYGTSGAGGIIPPNADLIFDVELLDFTA